MTDIDDGSAPTMEMSATKGVILASLPIVLESDDKQVRVQGGQR